MKIVFVVTCLNVGGAELMLQRLLQRLDKRYSTHVISLTTIGDVGARIRAMGVPVEAIGMQPGHPDLLGVVRLCNRMRFLKPDLVQTWMYHADLLGGLAARLAGVKAVVWSLRNNNLDADKTKFVTRQVVRLCAWLSERIPDRIVSCSEAARVFHQRLGYASKTCVVIPNGFDLKEFRPDETWRDSARAEWNWGDGVLIVGMLARFDPQKNHCGFIEAARLLQERLPTARFVLAGEGVEWGNKALSDAVDRAGLREKMRLLGRRSDMPRLLAGLDVLASPSHSEAFPNVVGEAMACGVPCVATDVGDSRLIIGDAGAVAAATSAQAIAKALFEVLSLTSTERVHLGRRARARIVESYSLEVCVRNYERVYDHLYEKATGAIVLGGGVDSCDQWDLEYPRHVIFAKRPLSWTTSDGEWHYKIPRVSDSVAKDARSAVARRAAEAEFRALKILSALSGAVVQPIMVIGGSACVVTRYCSGTNLRDALLESISSAARQALLQRAIGVLARLHRRFIEGESSRPPEVDFPVTEAFEQDAGPPQGGDYRALVIDGFEVRNLLVSDRSNEMRFFDPHRLSRGPPEEDVTRFIISVLMVPWGRGGGVIAMTDFSAKDLMSTYERISRVALDAEALKSCFSRNLDMRARNARMSVRAMPVAIRPAAALYSAAFFWQVRAWGTKNGF